MKNFVQPGKTIVLRSITSAVKSGSLVVAGDLAGVAVSDAEIGEDVSIVTEGVFYLEKVKAEAQAVGDKLAFTSASKLSKTLTSGKIVAVAVEPAIAQQTHVMAKLLPTVLPQAAAQSIGS